MIILIYLTFTIPICFILTRAIYKSSKQIILTRKTLKQPKINNLDTIHLVKAYILRKQWLSCIFMLEQLLDSESNTIELYNWLGFCYLSTKFYTISEEYYKRALIINPSNRECLQNLSNLYNHKHMNNKTKLKALNEQISQHP